MLAVRNGSSPKVSIPRPQRGSRKILIFGDQNVSPANRLRSSLRIASLYLARPSDRDHCRDLVHQRRVPRRRQADRLRKIRRESVARHAMQRFIPPVVRGNAQPRNGRRDILHLAHFFFQRHAAHEIFRARFGRQRWIRVWARLRTAKAPRYICCLLSRKSAEARLKMLNVARRTVSIFMMVCSMHFAGGRLSRPRGNLRPRAISGFVNPRSRAPRRQNSGSPVLFTAKRLEQASPAKLDARTTRCGCTSALLRLAGSLLCASFSASVAAIFPIILLFWSTEVSGTRRNRNTTNCRSPPLQCPPEHAVPRREWRASFPAQPDR